MERREQKTARREKKEEDEYEDEEMEALTKNKNPTRRMRGKTMNIDFLHSFAICLRMDLDHETYLEPIFFWLLN